MGDVVGSVAGVAIEVLHQNLISLCKEEIGLIRNFKKDLLKLKDSFELLQAFLDDAETKQETNGDVKIWLKRLEVVAFDADNVLDELNYEFLRKKVETGNKRKKKVQLKEKVQRFFSNSTRTMALKIKKKVQLKLQRFFSTRKMALKIREINEKLESINQDAKNYDLQTQLRIAHAPSVGLQRESDSKSIDFVVGRENYVSEIVDKFTSNSATHDKFSIIPIVGMGGLGKTTLANSVFNDGKIKNHFEKLIWVYVSENFDDNDLFKKILQSLTGQTVESYTRETLLTKIQQNLGSQKYLLVLDDVWNEKTIKWDRFIKKLIQYELSKREWYHCYNAK